MFELFNFNTGNDYLYYQELGYTADNIEKNFKADPRWYILSRIQLKMNISRNFIPCLYIMNSSKNQNLPILKTLSIYSEFKQIAIKVSRPYITTWCMCVLVSTFRFYEVISHL